MRSDASDGPASESPKKNETSARRSHSRERRRQSTDSSPRQPGTSRHDSPKDLPGPSGQVSSVIYDKDELKRLVINITRHKNKPVAPDIQRALGDPALIKPYRRPGEGAKPIFSHPGIKVNLHKCLDIPSLRSSKDRKEGRLKSRSPKSDSVSDDDSKKRRRSRSRDGRSHTRERRRRSRTPRQRARSERSRSRSRSRSHDRDRPRDRDHYRSDLQDERRLRTPAPDGRGYPPTRGPPRFPPPMAAFRGPVAPMVMLVPPPFFRLPPRGPMLPRFYPPRPPRE